jgi:histidyl-tRNA synthetase
MNHGQLTFPFKRYQMQPVWRADRPQKGRYREFYQCDADVVGSQSLLNEVELASIYHQAFQQLAIPIEIRINNRKILAALAEVCGGADNNSRERVSGKITHSRETSNDGPSAEPPVASLLTDITVAIDKLDKIGLEKVKEELTGRGLDDNQVAAIEQYLGIAGDNAVKLSQLKTLFAGSETGLKGIAELEYILEYTTGAPSIPVLSQADEASASASLNGAPTPEGRLPLIVDLTLARGLNYYTGTIFEVKATTVQMGSIGGGGRYDDLTGLFGVPNIPGVGISFGVDRIYDVMEELKLFPKDVHTGTKVLFFNLGDAESRAAFGLLQQLRAKGIPAEIYHEQAKFDKQFKYAEKKGIRYVVILGSEELGNRQCKIKDLSNGQQKTLGWEELVRLEF